MAAGSIFFCQIRLFRIEKKCFIFPCPPQFLRIETTVYISVIRFGCLDNQKNVLIYFIRLGCMLQIEKQKESKDLAARNGKLYQNKELLYIFQSDMSAENLKRNFFEFIKLNMRLFLFFAQLIKIVSTDMVTLSRKTITIYLDNLAVEQKKKSLLVYLFYQTWFA